MLLHGLTATRRYVVMGSRLLERSGHRVIAYDARGHGRSAPAPERAPTATSRWPATWGRCSTRSASSARCSRAPRWARTRPCASRWSTPSAWRRWRSSRPPTTRARHAGPATSSRLGRARATGCARAGWRASWRPMTSTRVPAAWRATVEKVLRQRLGRPRAPRGGRGRAGSRAALAPVRALRGAAQRSPCPTRRDRQPRRGRPRPPAGGGRTLRAGDPRRAPAGRGCGPAPRSPLAWQGGQLSTRSLARARRARRRPAPTRHT